MPVIVETGQSGWEIVTAITGVVAAVATAAAAVAAWINGDGSVTTFFSVASNLVAGDTNTCPVFQVPGECADIFVHVETSG